MRKYGLGSDSYSATSSASHAEYAETMALSRLPRDTCRPAQFLPRHPCHIQKRSLEAAEGKPSVTIAADATALVESISSTAGMGNWNNFKSFIAKSHVRSVSDNKETNIPCDILFSNSYLPFAVTVKNARLALNETRYVIPRRTTMNQEQKEKVAIFRFGVIFPLVEKNLHEYWGEKERIIRELVGKEWEIPFSTRTYISKATVLSWVRRYEDGGRKIEALFPENRGDKGRMRSITDEQIDLLMRLRTENPKLSTPRLVEKARAECVFPSGSEVSMASIYRLMKSGAKRQKAQQDMRKFEVQMANDLWQSDCMHGPHIEVDGKKHKTYLFAVIDDHSRLVTHGQFYLAENLENYLDCLWTAMRKRGVPRKLYVDNGASFRSHRLQLGCAALEVGLTYARPYRPQGKGKIERFFRTVRMQFLPELAQHLTLEKLNDLFAAYLEDRYHQTIHGTTGQKPIDRYLPT